MTGKIVRKFVTVKEAAEFLGRTEKAVRRMIEEEKLRKYKPDSRVMLDLEELRRFVQAGG